MSQTSSFQKGQHQKGSASDVPSTRQLRRTCDKELYRTAKRLKRWIPADKMEEAKQLYYDKVVHNLTWIVENGKNRKMLADWWEQAVAPDIAKLWGISEDKLARAFRKSFGG